MINKYTFEEFIKNEKSMSYEECNSFWEKAESKVHADTSDELMKEISEHIAERMELNKEDILLVIGGGGGYIDRFLISKVKKLIAIDFSGQKIIDAKKRNPEGEYYRQDFLKEYDYLKKYKINKIYSYSVMQYCKPEDFSIFIKNQLSVLDENKSCLIGHLDVPDVDKAMFYYDKICVDATEEKVKKYRDKIKYLIGDGSCWHNMDKIKNILDNIASISEVEIKNAHYWKFRSDIIFRVNYV